MMAELTPTELSIYRAAAVRRAAAWQGRSADMVARDRLLKRVQQAALVLKRKYGASRVILFGSLAHDSWYGSDSDIDLAVEGLPGETFWQAWRVVEELVGERPVDLVELESAREPLRCVIERTGIVL
jgi:predicted nucleotidyltransferase